MAYKFQIGAAKLSGSIQQTDGDFLTAKTELRIGDAQLTEVELEKLDGITNGTVAANKAVVVDGNKDASGFRNVGATQLSASAGLLAGSLTLGGTAVSATATELNFMDGFTEAVYTQGADSIVFFDANDSKFKRDSNADFLGAISKNGIEVDSNQLQVALDGGTLAQGAGGLSVANDGIDSAQIADDAVNSEHIALGALDAEHYSTGSIENNHLAGAIANAKLENSSVTIGSTSVSLGATQTTFAGITQLTASNILVTNLDVVTINSINQTETTLEVSDKKIVAGLSGSSENGYAYQFGGGADDNGLAAMKYFDAGGGTVGLKFAIGDNDQLTIRNDLIIPEGNNEVSLGNSSNAFSALHTQAITLGGTAITSTAAELNLLDGNVATINNVTDVAGTDGLILNDGTTMKQCRVSNIVDLAGRLSISASANSATLQVGMNYFGDLTSTQAEVNLPASPNVGDVVYVKAGNLDSDSDILISPQGSHTIDSNAGIVLESPFAAVTLVYVVADDWRIV